MRASHACATQAHSLDVHVSHNQLVDRPSVNQSVNQSVDHCRCALRACIPVSPRTLEDGELLLLSLFDAPVLPTLSCTEHSVGGT